MDFLALSVLAEAVGAGSLAAAARRLHITPMAATRSLSGLEHELGVRLLHRTTRSLSLTDEGQVFLAHAQALLEERDAALASVRPAEAGATGRLRLTASTAVGRQVVAPARVGVMRAPPGGRGDHGRPPRVVDLVGEGLDLGIRIAVMSDSSLVARHLGLSPRGLFATPGYLAAAGIPARAADLAAHECLALAGTGHWALGPVGQAVSVRAAGRFTANTIEGLHQACLGGLGIAMLSRWDVADEVAGGLLAEVRLAEGEPEPLAIWAVYPTRRMVPAKVRLFIRFLAERLEA